MDAENKKQKNVQKNQKNADKGDNQSRYVRVDALGKMIRPQYVTEHFNVILEKNGLKLIRFHDLRHSCASMLLANKVPMKMIQDWLGHSDMSTTVNTKYGHTKDKNQIREIKAALIQVSRAGSFPLVRNFLLYCYYW